MLKIVAVILAALISLPTMAQRRDAIVTVSLAISDPGRPESSCGATRQSLENEAVRVLRNNGIRVSDASSASSLALMVRISAFATPSSRCGVIITSVQVAKFVPWDDWDDKLSPRSGLVMNVYCESTMVSIGSRDRPAAIELESEIHNCVGQLDF
jgi:hypothetical protein